MTVIVPARNAVACLPKLLSALEGQSLDAARYEVIVVDDASTDGTPDVVRASPVARVIPLGAQGGSYSARNAALPHARADVLAFTDADCVPAGDWIERGLEAMHRSGADLVAGRIDASLGSRPSGAALLGLAKHHLDQEYHVEEQGFGATANLWVRRRVLDRVGPFDSEVTSGGDGEFCRRATAGGATLLYEPGVVVGHPPRSRARELVAKQLRIGFGLAQLRQRDQVEEVRRVWSQPGAYIPRRIRGVDVLERRGYKLTRFQLARLAALDYVCSRLPFVVGNLAGTVHELRLRSRPARR